MTRRRFTMIEVLAALLLVGLVVPVAVQAVLVSNRAHVAAERRDVASRLASEKLTDLVLTGEWQDAEDAGTFDDYPDYQWALTTATWEGDDVNLMRQITVEVQYLVQNNLVSVSASTLVREVTEE